MGVEKGDTHGVAGPVRDVMRYDRRLDLHTTTRELTGLLELVVVEVGRTALHVSTRECECQRLILLYLPSHRTKGDWADNGYCGSDPDQNSHPRFTFHWLTPVSAAFK